MMGQLHQMLLVLVMMVSLEGWLPHGCLEEERIALLQLKHSFNFPNGTSLPSWRKDDTHCCNWERIECNGTTGRVTQIDLSNRRFWELMILEMRLRDWYLNASLFLSFEELNALYLSGNGIVDCVENEGFQKLWQLNNLEILDLSDNNFNNISILISSLSGLSSLKSLYLFNNELKGSISIDELNRLKSLEELDLEYNEIEGFKSYHGGEQLLKLNNLEYFSLRHNHFDNNILSSFKGLSSLKYLSLGYNKVRGLINLKELDALSNLEKLSLSGNDINKIVGSRGMRNLSYLGLCNITIYGKSVQLLQSLGAFPNLTALNLCSNDFKGTIFGEELLSTTVEELNLDGSSLDENSLQSLGALPSLKTLYLRYLNGTLPSQGLPNLKNLEVLDLSFSTLNHSFFENIGRTPSLKTLKLRYCGLNGTIPAAQGLCELKHLQGLYVMSNNLSGNLPLCLENLTSLRVLDLSFNDFIGDISLSPLKSLKSIQNIDLSDNHFQIPFSLSTFFNHSKLEYFSGSNNHILGEEKAHNFTPKFQLQSLYLDGGGHGGAFPKFLYHQHNLRFVDLSNMEIEEEFPNWLLENNTNLESLLLASNSISGQFRLPTHSHMSLSNLDISNNYIQGHIPAKIGAYLPRLWSLSMHGNGFSGSIPSSFGNMSSLYSLNLSSNGFSGSIPSSFGNMSSLDSLDLSSNVLAGIIPEHLTIGCSRLNTLILSNNSLQGQIFPPNINLKSLNWLQLDGNKFIGGIPDSLSNCSYLTMLDVRNNSLFGRIPRWMGNMSYLEFLDLSQNSFSGILPSGFISSTVQYVYLSKNKLQGSVAGAFYDCLELLALDLSHNYLTGSIPQWIDRLYGLSFLLLSYNNLDGELPIQLCKLDQLSLIDLSHNNLSGYILHCLIKSRQQEAVSNYSMASAPQSSQQSFEFTMKNVSLSYQGSILKYISGIDLSCNNLTGTIPPEIGNLSMIKVLNLSHNSLIGPIPPTFSNLKEIESLDLSYNMLDGKIPPQMTELYSLAVFSVAHNNLSGKTPDRVAQFATFEESSYKDNPFLCGLPLPKSCGASMSQSPMPISLNNEERSGFMDMEVFYVSFVVTYIMVLLGIGAVLYINPYWRRVWFYFIEVSITTCYYFLVDNLSILSKFRFNSLVF